ncbi:thiosulfate/3-mercaptopyruvate sulfurtransferase [Actinoalloteichus hoggarensis]|uniref:3-mercaptopyruvate sulfurtransferase n=1 Tax=Actinoalloteichus hoggarensis TaxID=1470176 RepID=A0A221W0H0_9PSEU|nr:sulfurtransferase [Actinoalloteichus hoggarensis]ASO19286.1 3-mercaptopyruvate sulfurtransferase [Actinoalloteichus hoggarensis]MBB5920524.1 thiosulfate/3-mercaptopyruvate sulfurtransferase [Actinoalloteichus hoggarensis]
MQPLVSTEELAEAMAGENPPVLLDVRWALTGPPGLLAYEAGHLPGAVFLDLDRDLAAPAGPGGRHPLPAPEDLEAVLRAAGVGADRPVVAYDAADGSVAARAWWLLRWSGHEQVAVLDGGFAAWTAEGREVTTVVPHPEPGDVVVLPGSLPVLDAAGAEELAERGVLLDARAPQRYRGEVEPVDARPGHVPGARNAPFVEHLDESGRWRSPAELAERFAALGVTEGTPVGAYCGSGVTACSVLLALETAGLSGPDRPAALYAGSWSEWAAQPRRRAVLGASPR